MQRRQSCSRGSGIDRVTRKKKHQTDSREREKEREKERRKWNRQGPAMCVEVKWMLAFLAPWTLSQTSILPAPLQMLWIERGNGGEEGRKRGWENSRGETTESLISLSVNIKNIDISRPYISDQLPYRFVLKVIICILKWTERNRNAIFYNTLFLYLFFIAWSSFGASLLGG